MTINVDNIFFSLEGVVLHWNHKIKQSLESFTNIGIKKSASVDNQKYHPLYIKSISPINADITKRF